MVRYDLTGMFFTQQRVPERFQTVRLPENWYAQHYFSFLLYTLPRLFSFYVYSSLTTAYGWKEVVLKLHVYRYTLQRPQTILGHVPNSCGGSEPSHLCSNVSLTFLLSCPTASLLICFTTDGPFSHFISLLMICLFDFIAAIQLKVCHETANTHRS